MQQRAASAVVSSSSSACRRLLAAKAAPARFRPASVRGLVGCDALPHRVASSSSSSGAGLHGAVVRPAASRLPSSFLPPAAAAAAAASLRRLATTTAAAASVDAPPADADSKAGRAVAKAGGKPADVVAAATAIDLPTSDESDSLLRIRHSCAHIMAMAVQRVRPGTQVTIGPWIDNGFYYDFDTGEAPLTDADLPVIKKEMTRIIKARLPIVREEVSADEAASRIAAAGEPYKAEILEGIRSRDPAAAITIYHIGDPGQPGTWWDLCAGPHVEDTGKIDPSALALESVAGAYWRGDETKAQLQRVYGTAWENKAQLKAYAALKAEAARRDHRKLGAELDLFSIGDETGPGLVLWHPAGALVRSLIEDYWRSLHLAAGYDLLYTPHIARLDLWKTSGHYDFYRDGMFESMPVDADAYQLRPMNCPFHIAVYQKGLRSYRDLPLRWCELGTVYRYERSGTMHGLFRVRGFTQDDGHIFCLPSQISDEIRGTLDLVESVMAGFGFTDLEVNLSTRPEKSVGSDEIWATAEAALVEALGAKGWPYKIDPGGGAFYGPKIDVKVRDALGRKWQCSTIQLDFNLPARFGMEYVDEANTRRAPIMIHRAIFGSLERFFGILIENYAGAFPLWLSPVQVRLLCVAEAFTSYAEEVAATLRARGLRVKVDSGERIAKLVRAAEKAKTPVMGVIGEREVADRTLAVRTYAGGDVGSFGVGDLADKLVAAVVGRGGVDW